MIDPKRSAKLVIALAETAADKEWIRLSKKHGPGAGRTMARTPSEEQLYALDLAVGRKATAEERSSFATVYATQCMTLALMYASHDPNDSNQPD